MARKNMKVKKHKRAAQILKTIQPDSAGIDLGSREHWVAGPPNQDNTPNVKCFGTTTPELVRLAEWLKDQGVKTVAMESTGVYWIPVFEILDNHGFEVLLIHRLDADEQAATFPAARPICLTVSGSNGCTPAVFCEGRFVLPTTSVG